MHRAAPKFMRQSITLTGLGTDTFNDAIQSIQSIEDLFSRQIGEGRIIPWKMGSYQQWDTIFASNRYFTTGQKLSYIPHVPFHNLVDPDGVLAALIQDNRVHCSDNEVEYYELTKDNK
jgi:hypothetical protein